MQPLGWQPPQGSSLWVLNFIFVPKGKIGCSVNCVSDSARPRHWKKQAYEEIFNLDLNRNGIFQPSLTLVHNFAAVLFLYSFPKMDNRKLPPSFISLLQLQIYVMISHKCFWVVFITREQTRFIVKFRFQASICVCNDDFNWSEIVGVYAWVLFLRWKNLFCFSRFPLCSGTWF